MNVLDAFAAEVGRPPSGVWRAPGRVNLIGDHTDYSDGFVLPFAIDRDTRIAAAPRADGELHCRSLELGVADAVPLTELSPAPGRWWSYVHGVASLLAPDAASAGGVDLVIESTVPVGAGLSSSAALSCATAVALADLWGVMLDRTSLALVARRAEREFAGVPCGVMDQMAAMHGRTDAALLIDTRSLEVTAIPFPPEGYDALVVDTNVAHDVGEGPYGERLASCLRAAEQLGVAALRDATLRDVLSAEPRLDETVERRAKHVVEENRRVLDAADALRSGNVRDLGRLMLESHASLRDDHEVSTRELDLVVEAAVAHGAVGARMTGAGFGGSVICLVEHEAVPSVVDGVTRAAAAATAPTPTFLSVAPASGAGRLD